MADEDRRRRGGFFVALLAAIATPRFLVPLIASTTLTGAVAGPLALQALAARDEPAEVAAPAPTTTVAPTTTTTSTTTTTTTTTSTTTTTVAPTTTSTAVAVAPTTLAPTTTTTTTAAPSTTTSTTSTTTTTTTTVPPDPTIAVTSVGALEPGRAGMVAVRLDPGGVAGPIAFTLDVDGADVLDLVGDGWACAGDPTTCTGVSTGETIDLFVRLDVDAAASEVTVTVDDEVLVVPTAVAELSARFAAVGAVDVAVVGNAQMRCPAGVTVDGFSCEDVLAGLATGSAASNNAWAMEWVDADDRTPTATSNSSSATVADLGEVLFAGLHWGGRTTGPAGAAHEIAAITVTDGVVPDATGDYTTVTADELLATGDAYQAFADVTSLIQAAQTAGDDPLTVWVADLVADPGTNAYAGWTLTVVHRAAGADQSVVVLDGFREVLSGSAAEVTIVGADGPGDSSLTVVAYETDAGLGPDGIRIDGAPVSEDFEVFDSISTGTTGSRDPDPVNALGHDIDRFDVSALLEPGASSAALRFETAGDTYAVGVVVVTSGG